MSVEVELARMSKHILLIGGNSGIGMASAMRLKNEGHELLAAARSAEPLTQIGIPTQAFEASGEVKLELPDPLDGLIYFPGTITLKPFHRLSEQDFLHDLQVNLLGAAKAIQAALPALKKSESASIVLFSTVAVAQGMAFHASIAAAKGAVEGLAKSLAAELAPRIRVNVIAPSLTDTPLAGSLLGSEERQQAAAKRHPLNQVGDTEDIAQLVSFLMSDASKFMSGQTLRPDGGLSTLRTF